METAQVLTLALIQGLTEFLPISSSGHLVLVPSLVSWPDQGIAFDVALHVGTLAAVLAYFRSELAGITRDWIRSVRGRRQVGQSMLGWAVIAGTVPAGTAGIALEAYGVDGLRAPEVIGVASIFFGLLLWWADRQGIQARDEHRLRWRDVIIIGLAQSLALVPGTSRSGITITAAMAMGLTRAAAARFSFLLSIPIIAAAGLLEGVKAVSSPEVVRWGDLLLGASVASVSAYLCIHYFLKLVTRVGMTPFVVYRVVLGTVILVAL